MKLFPKLTPQHRLARLDWARDRLREGRSFWKRIIFSDEKRFNLDGPDGLSFYWADKRLDNRYFSKRQHGGGSVMVWGAFCRRGTSPLILIFGTMNAVKYCNVLEEALFPFANEAYKTKWVFQQDNARSHTTDHTKQFFTNMSVVDVDWTACSPDLKPIENLWGS